ncbi:hypothetical protein OKW32_003841 [Paraburkholderia youngii]
MKTRSAGATVLNLVPRLTSVKNSTSLVPFSADRSRCSYRPVARHSVVLMRESEMSAGGASFIRFAKDFKPGFFLDLRIAPRLDFLAGSRLQAFRLFHELDIEYVDVLGRLGIDSKEDFSSLDEAQSAELASWIESNFNDERPLVCFFDDAEVLFRCRDAFSRIIDGYIFGRPDTRVSEYKAGLLAL